jgi:hypothetical protein
MNTNKKKDKFFLLVLNSYILLLLICFDPNKIRVDFDDLVF